MKQVEQYLGKVMKGLLFTLYATIISLLMVSSVKADAAVGESVEWLTADSDVVCFAQPLSVQQGPPEDKKLRYSRISFKITERLYGPSEKDDIISIYTGSSPDHSPIDWDEAIRLKRSILILAKIKKETRSAAYGRYGFLSVFAPELKISKLYRPDSGVVTDYDEVVERCKKESLQRIDYERRNYHVERTTIDVIWGSEAHKKLYSGSWCGIYAPKYVKP